MHKLTKNSFHALKKTVKANERYLYHEKKFSSLGKRTVLGIETSCDDTGAAVVDEDGTILGEAINSQTKLHVEMGGIIPPLARDLHKQHIREVVQEAMGNARISLNDVDAIATTVKPGLIMSLDIGMKYTRELIEKSGKLFIPIHHMEAHALMARMIDCVPFPFLVLLVSGGHCLLAVAKDVEEFLLLGKSLDTAPGDAFDKVARALKLKNLPECNGLSGGASIELLAESGNPGAFIMTPTMHRHYNCDFSFSGVRTKFEQIIKDEESKTNHEGSEVLLNANDICASFQHFILKHLVNRLQRAIIYCHTNHLLDVTTSTVVVSGGVASNAYLRRGLQKACEVHHTRLVCPPPRLCTDNGIMVAWNGMEKVKADRGVMDIHHVDIQAKCPLGRDISSDVMTARIKVDRLKPS